jgi:hypothetical protein
VRVYFTSGSAIRTIWACFAASSFSSAVDIPKYVSGHTGYRDVIHVLLGFARLDTLRAIAVPTARTHCHIFVPTHHCFVFAVGAVLSFVAIVCI